MSEQSDYMKALIEACNNRDDWHKGGITLGGISEQRRQCGELLAKWRKGVLDATDAESLRKFASYLDNALAWSIERGILQALEERQSSIRGSHARAMAQWFDVDDACRSFHLLLERLPCMPQHANDM